MLLVIGSRALHHHGLIEYSDVNNSDWDFIASPGEWIYFKNRMNGTEVEVQSPN
ncbi:DUF7277 domain-containing protein, partial [Salmonella enterica]|uniref:DUF7277 domain-containing protein n=1 Tax=Salmonella enterica TaxID=28901 RepID=UPI003CE67BB0